MSERLKRVIAVHRSWYDRGLRLGSNRDVAYNLARAHELLAEGEDDTAALKLGRAEGRRRQDQGKQLRG